MVGQEINVGIYGTRWLSFMESNHPKFYRKLEREGTLYEVARSVHIYAAEYKQLLDKQYDEYHYAPKVWLDEEERRSWEFTRDFYTDGEVMRESVLKLYTKV